jgi:DNA-binding response OmpR family regulator
MTTTIRILIVDDDELNLELYETLLKEHHYSVTKARDGVEALDRFAKYQPDLVIVDLMMPRLNGLEFCARLRRTPHGRTVPILVLTGLDEPAARQKALQHGASDFLAKPFKTDALLERIRTLLKS